MFSASVTLRPFLELAGAVALWVSPPLEIPTMTTAMPTMPTDSYTDFLGAKVAEAQALGFEPGHPPSM